MSWTMTIPVLSTMHITADTNACMQNLVGDWSGLEFAEYSNGFFIALGESDTDPAEQFPEHPDLQEVMRWVHQNHPEATWVRLDVDGDVVDGLSKYEW